MAVIAQTQKNKLQTENPARGSDLKPILRRDMLNERKPDDKPKTPL
jgi:hypothetical protein